MADTRLTLAEIQATPTRRNRAQIAATDETAIYTDVVPQH